VGFLQVLIFGLLSTLCFRISSRFEFVDVGESFEARGGRRPLVRFRVSSRFELVDVGESFEARGGRRPHGQERQLVLASAILADPSTTW